jgi:hypothetical protein
MISKEIARCYTGNAPFGYPEALFRWEKERQGFLNYHHDL